MLHPSTLHAGLSGLVRAFLWCATVGQVRVLVHHVTSPALARTLTRTILEGGPTTPLAADLVCYLAHSTLGIRDLLEAGLLPVVTGLLFAQSCVVPATLRALLRALHLVALSPAGSSALWRAEGLWDGLLRCATTTTTNTNTNTNTNTSTTTSTNTTTTTTTGTRSRSRTNHDDGDEDDDDLHRHGPGDDGDGVLPSSSREDGEWAGCGREAAEVIGEMVALGTLRDWQQMAAQMRKTPGHEGVLEAVQARLGRAAGEEADADADAKDVGGRVKGLMEYVKAVSGLMQSSAI